MTSSFSARLPFQLNCLKVQFCFQGVVFLTILTLRCFPTKNCGFKFSLSQDPGFEMFPNSHFSPIEACCSFQLELAAHKSCGWSVFLSRHIDPSNVFDGFNLPRKNIWHFLGHCCVFKTFQLFWGRLFWMGQTMRTKKVSGIFQLKCIRLLRAGEKGQNSMYYCKLPWFN